MEPRTNSHTRATGTISPPGSRSAGFTLIELLAVIGIAGILFGIGVPSFRNFVLSQRVKSAAFDVASALTLARSEAIKRNASIVIAPSTAGANGWKDGWTVKAGTTTLSQQAAMANITITGPATNLTYSNNGRIIGAANVTFQISDAASHSRCITVDLSGMPKTKSGSC